LGFLNIFVIILIAAVFLSSGCSSALHNAARRNDIIRAKNLLQKGADVNKRNLSGRRPIHYATRYGNARMVKLLLQAGADVHPRFGKGGTALHHAARHGDAEMVKLLFQAGADVNVKTKDGWRPIHLAACYGDSEIVKLLLQAGADINVKTNDGWTPFKLVKKKHNSYQIDKISNLLLNPPPLKNFVLKENVKKSYWKPIPKKIPTQMRSEKVVLSESIRKIRGKGYPENITDTFSSDDPEIIASVKLMNLSGKHDIRWDWIAPDNSLYYSTDNKSINAPGGKYLKEVTALHRLGVRGKRGAAYLGAWKVKIYLDDKNIATTFFKLEAAASKEAMPEDRPKPPRAKTRLFDDW